MTSTHIGAPKNGVDVAALFATLDAVKAQPEIAQFQFRARNQWISGTQSRTAIQGFYGAGQEDTSRTEPFSKVSWGSDQPGFRQVYDARFLPDGPLESWRAFDELQRRTTSANNAHRLWRAFGSLDAAEAARTLDVPTLLLHSRDDLVWSFSEAEELHSLIAASRLVCLDSRNHILQAGEPAFTVFIEELQRFLATSP